MATIGEPMSKAKPLEIKMTDGVLEISIGTDTLRQALLDSERFDNVQIIDQEEFLTNYLDALQRELEEDGTQPVHKLFEDTLEFMLEQGDSSVEEKDDSEDSE